MNRNCQRSFHLPYLLWISTFLGLATSTFGQSLETNALKYDTYRMRLLQGFVRVGPQPGESLVAGIRNYGYTGSHDIDYGDQTIYQGWYIGVLATEYARLRKQEQPTSTTLSELYYALQAVNRLDLAGEQLIQAWDAKAELNGYLVREDVPVAFFENPSVQGSAHPHFGWPEVKKVRAIAQHPAEAERRLNNEMSQDQVYHLLIGLALTRRFLPDSMVNISLLDGQTEGVNLQKTAQEIALRIGMRLRENRWIIRNPIGKKVKRGPNCKPYSYALAEAVEYITDQSVQNGFSRVSKLVWQSLRNVGSAAFANKDNRHMALAVGAVGDAWRAKKETPRNQKKAGLVIARLSKAEGWQGFYPLLWAVIHDRELPDVLSVTEENLDNAPVNGPYWYSPDQQSGKGWGCSHRYYHHLEDQMGLRPNGDFYAFSGYYSGVDYLLLYNLWWLQTQR